jgi:hypothetical protein
LNASISSLSENTQSAEYDSSNTGGRGTLGAGDDAEADDDNADEDDEAVSKHNVLGRISGTGNDTVSALNGETIVPTVASFTVTLKARLAPIAVPRMHVNCIGFDAVVTDGEVHTKGGAEAEFASPNAIDVVDALPNDKPLNVMLCPETVVDKINDTGEPTALPELRRSEPALTNGLEYENKLAEPDAVPYVTTTGSKAPVPTRTAQVNRTCGLVTLTESHVLPPTVTVGMLANVDPLPKFAPFTVMVVAVEKGQLMTAFPDCVQLPGAVTFVTTGAE